MRHDVSEWGCQCTLGCTCCCVEVTLLSVSSLCMLGCWCSWCSCVSVYQCHWTGRLGGVWDISWHMSLLKIVCGYSIDDIASSRGPLPKLFKLCPWDQNWPRPVGQNFTLIYIRKTLNIFFSQTANGNLTKLNRNDPWPTNIVQTVVIGCISRSQCYKIGFQNANLLVQNYKAQCFHIWYTCITSSRGSLQNLFKFCPWGQNWPRLGGHNFTLNYIRKSSNDFFS